eukprot:1608526-Rhodomonas_salina.2
MPARLYSQPAQDNRRTKPGGTRHQEVPVGWRGRKIRNSGRLIRQEVLETDPLLDILHSLGDSTYGTSVQSQRVGTYSSSIRRVSIGGTSTLRQYRAARSRSVGGDESVPATCTKALLGCYGRHLVAAEPASVPDSA